ncbi:hypothetical protein ZIOFF_070065 [Zingiber officinale]|uniref:Multiple C2 domain-containing protein n=1 Tax=Zingiber officinale TaxID=94328 RepID=A0A8J5C6X4_ZINOF|nr:hypothetical protein ZIOFF_070065 [Zingiber officinale]
MRLDCRVVSSKWYHLVKHVVADGEQKKEVRLASHIHLRLSLDGGYHVLDESTHYSSDLRPTAKRLWKPSIGILKLGILTAQASLPMKTKDGCDQSLTGGEKANGVTDNRIGKVRIRLSTLETDKVYTHSYPLLVLHTSGVKKMGEFQLAVRFSSSSLFNMLHIYSRPLLPKMHYLHPLTHRQLISLRHQSTQIVSMRLNRAEPPLRKEVVEYMLDVDVGYHMWSMRRSKANFFRIMGVFSGLIATGKWFSQICLWKNPITTVLIHVLFVILVLYPELILPTMFLYLFLIGVWYYGWRPRKPPHMDTRLSHADTANPDELDEEFDRFPSTRPPEIIRVRYDRLRSVAGKVQTVVGDLATQGERY